MTKSEIDPSDRSLLARMLPRAILRSAVYDRLSWGVLGLATLVALWTFGDYGVSMDENPHVGYGARILAWYASGFTDEASLTFRANYYYGGGFDLLGALVRNFLAPMEEIRAMHLLNAVVGLLGLAGTWRLARELAGPRAGFLGLVLVTVNPVLWGHMFNNPKDTPFASAYVWGVYFMVKAIAELPQPSRATLTKMAVAVGLAMSVRIGGLLLICVFAAVLGVHWLAAAWQRRSVVAAEAYGMRLAKIFGAVLGGAWVVMLLGWPWVQLDPLRRPLTALVRMSGFDAHIRNMPFAGVEVSNRDLGWDYLPHYFALQTPEFVVILWCLATLGGLWALARHGWRPRWHRQALALLAVGMAIFVPPVYAVVKGTILYDNYRHFLFVIPCICALAGVLVDHWLSFVRHRVVQVAIAAAFAMLVADTVTTMVRLHPHQYVYFNRWIGGLAGAVDNYDTDYYGHCHREAVEAIPEYLWAQDRKAYLNGVFGYSACSSKFAVGRYLPPNFRARNEVKGFAGHDFHAGYHRYHCHERYPKGAVIARIGREGGELCVVKDLRKNLAKILERTQGDQPDNPKSNEDPTSATAAAPAAPAAPANAPKSFPIQPQQPPPAPVSPTDGPEEQP